MTTYTDYGVLRNPYQGDDKKVVFVCSAGILRSATAARHYARKYNTRAAGTYDCALIRLTPALVEWADEVVFVNRENYNMACNDGDLYAVLLDKPTKVLAIPDTHEHMAPELIQAFKEQYEDID